jgi:hypothetical protein
MVVQRSVRLLQSLQAGWNIFDLAWDQATPADFIALPQMPWYTACGSKLIGRHYLLAVSHRSL